MLLVEAYDVRNLHKIPLLMIPNTLWGQFFPGWQFFYTMSTRLK